MFDVVLSKLDSMKDYNISRNIYVKRDIQLFLERVTDIGQKQKKIVHVVNPKIKNRMIYTRPLGYR